MGRYSRSSHGWCGSARRASLLLLGVASVAALPARAHGQQPWLVSGAEATRDSQERQRLRAHAELGGYVRPDATLALRLGGERLRADGASGSGAPAGAGRFAGRESRPMHASASAALVATLSLPAVRTGLRAEAGALLGAPRPGAAWVGSGSARVALGGGVAVRALAERERYAWTVASLDTLVIGRSLELALDRAAEPGWAGEIVARQNGYGDGNPVRTAYGWLLAPVARAERHGLRVGYALAWQDAAQSRWAPAPGTITARRAPAHDEPVAGRYDPYYTPHDVLTHSALAEAVRAVGAGWLKVEAAYGVRASETAPTLVRTAGGAAAPVELRFFERSFTPWRAGASWSAPLDGATWLTAEARYATSAFYRLGGVRLVVARAL